MSVVLVLLVLLSCWRVARLIVVDEITATARAAFVAGHRPRWERVGGNLVLVPFEGAVNFRRGWAWREWLVSCQWCVSMWTSPPIAVVAVWWPDNRAVWAVLLALAGSAVAGVGQTFEDVTDVTVTRLRGDK